MYLYANYIYLKLNITTATGVKNNNKIIFHIKCINQIKYFVEEKMLGIMFLISTIFRPTDHVGVVIICMFWYSNRENSNGLFYINMVNFTAFVQLIYYELFAQPYFCHKMLSMHMRENRKIELMAKVYLIFKDYIKHFADC